MITIEQTHTLIKESGLDATYSIIRKDTGEAVGSVTCEGNRFWRATYNGAESVADTRWQAVGRAHKQARRTCTYCERPATHKGEGERVCSDHIYPAARSEYREEQA